MPFSVSRHSSIRFLVVWLSVMCRADVVIIAKSPSPYLSLEISLLVFAYVTLGENLALGQTKSYTTGCLVHTDKQFGVLVQTAYNWTMETEILAEVAKSSAGNSSLLAYIVGSNGLLAFIVLWVVKLWINEKLGKLDKVDSVSDTLIEIRKDLEYMDRDLKTMQEQLGDFRHPLKKVDSMDRNLAILERDIKAAHRRMDEWSQTMRGT